ncbi:hypothetical protein H1P_730017 [Hyella patelloides LEGE 07179]|uniref:Uncharacterized protein n=1 Tax=Hyella patelloides LEGE 07179 TaxID=945734 RepID=A0A563W3M1_9CYAN|nr:hypothetical protein H1P_730017 [Hyella patelloides LEGE 07179]
MLLVIRKTFGSSIILISFRELYLKPALTIKFFKLDEFSIKESIISIMPKNI